METNTLTDTVVATTTALDTESPPAHVSNGTGRQPTERASGGKPDLTAMKSRVSLLLTTEASSQFDLGDALHDLQRASKSKWKDLGREFGRDGSTLCTYAKVATAFPAESRKYTKGFSWYAAVYAGANASAKQSQGLTGAVEPDYEGWLAKCETNAAKTETSRDVKAFIENETNKTVVPADHPATEPPVAASTLKCERLSDIAALQTCRALKAKIIHAHGLANAHDFFVELGRRLDEHLAENGVVLFRDSELVMDAQTQQAIERAGLTIGTMLPWPVKQPDAPDSHHPLWVSSFAPMYVLFRATDEFSISDDAKPQSNLVFVERGGARRHAIELLLKQHSNHGDAVVTVGDESFAAAALRLGRQCIVIGADPTESAASPLGGADGHGVEQGLTEASSSTPDADEPEPSMADVEDIDIPTPFHRHEEDDRPF